MKRQKRRTFEKAKTNESKSEEQLEIIKNKNNQFGIKSVTNFVGEDLIQDTKASLMSLGKRY